MTRKGGDLHGYTFEQMREFAELIVQECIQVAAQTPCPYEDEFHKRFGKYIVAASQK